MAAPPPLMVFRLVRSKLAKLGLASRSMIMVGMLVKLVTFQREIRRPASSRSQRGIRIMVAPAYTEACITATMPVMWNIGTTTRPTVSAVATLHSAQATALCMIEACVCMQPLGRPVVPLV